MKPLLADTSALIAIGNKDDAFHNKAVQSGSEKPFARKHHGFTEHSFMILLSIKMRLSASFHKFM